VWYDVANCVLKSALRFCNEIVRVTSGVLCEVYVKQNGLVMCSSIRNWAETLRVTVRILMHVAQLMALCFA
jgi:hypothetical protein